MENPNNLNVSDFETAWNSTYMKNVRKQMLNGEMSSCNPNVIKKKLQDIIQSVCGKHTIGVSVLMLIKLLQIQKKMDQISTISIY